MSDPSEVHEATEPEDDEDFDAYIGEPIDAGYLERLSEEMD